MKVLDKNSSLDDILAVLDGHEHYWVFVQWAFGQYEDGMYCKLCGYSPGIALAAINREAERLERERDGHA